MNDLLQLLASNGAGLVALTMIFYQQQQLPKILKDLAATIKDQHTLINANVKTLEKIFDVLSEHTHEVEKLDLKIDNLSANMQKSIDEIKHDLRSK